MEKSKLSLKKLNNIATQIEYYKNEIDTVSHSDAITTMITLKSGREILVRDFYEFYVDGQSLISLIGKAYWGDSDNGFFNFFESNVGCLGSFGKQWDELIVSKLLKENSESNENSLGQFSEEFLFYDCQQCGDPECGGISLMIIKSNDSIIWTDEDKIRIEFQFNEYKLALDDYLENSD